MAVISNCAILLVLTAAVLMVPSSATCGKRSKRDWFEGTLEVDIDDLKFLLYTRKNPNDPIEIKPREQDQSKRPLYLNQSHKFKIITHGFKGSAKDDWIMKAKTAYLEKKNYNVIVLDWSKYAAYHEKYKYTKAVKATNQVGVHLANMLIGLIKKFVFDADQLHLIGHSLGAYVMASAGRRFYKNTEEQIARITATCPAGPCYGYSIDAGNIPLSKDCAKFVDVIHTDGGNFGHYFASGHVDFYPNGGLQHPGCTSYRHIDWLNDIPCSQDIAHDLFVESIKSLKFIARTCTSYEAYKNRQCMEKKARMGENVKHSARGAFYLQTKWKAPFAMNGRIRKERKNKKKRYWAG